MAASVSALSHGDDQRFGLSRHVVLPGPLRLDGGGLLSPVEIGYETYGTLNADGSNALLICHALTGDQHVASPHPRTGKPGWWTRLVGEGKPIDPARHFVICSNVIGSCMGSSGPATIDPSTAEPWAMRFPVITIRDMVRAQAMLLDHLGVGQLKAVVGGSMGGMQALSWAATFPERVRACVMVASTARHSAQNIAFHEVGRAAIHSDPDWQGGRYWEAGIIPAKGLSVARMVAHITYLSEKALTRKFGRRLRGASALTFLEDVFEVESYLRHQGSTFVRRFDANSYLTITRAMDFFDLAADHEGDLAKAFRGTATRFFVASFNSDWLFPTSESRTLVRALNMAAANVSFVEIDSDKGHDAFLLEEPDFHRALGGFLAGCAERLGV
jgi:homoserine O-acetyltransferase